jgi:hypothetical protein
MRQARRSAVALLLVSVISSGCEIKPETNRNKNAVNHPENILPDVAWSFRQALPENYSAFLFELNQYAKEIGAALREVELSSKLPFSFVDIRYEYGVQSPTGVWDDVVKILRLRPSEAMTRGELLYEIHRACHAFLKDQDHCYYEGLWLLNEENEQGIPFYEMYLGS